MRIGDLDMNVRTAGNGVPLLWAHGMMSSMDIEDAQDLLQWQHFPASLRLVRYDARGHGASASATAPLAASATAPAAASVAAPAAESATDPATTSAAASASASPTAPTWQRLGHDMLALADALGEDDFIGGGWSMGCATALHAALQQPARVKGLVLAMPPALWEARVAQAALYRRAVALAQSMGSARFARLLASQGAAFPQWLLDAAPHLAGSMGSPDPAALPALYDGAARSDLPPRAALASLSAIPALIVAWAGDPIHPLASAQELHRLLPRSSLFIAHNYQDVLTIPARLRAFAFALATVAGNNR